jgi:hypothetical protein
MENAPFKVGQLVRHKSCAWAGIKEVAFLEYDAGMPSDNVHRTPRGPKWIVGVAGLSDDARMFEAVEG